MAGKFIPQIEEVLGAGDLEEVKRLTYEALKAIAERLPQADIVVTKGSPDNELKAGQGTMIALNSDPATQGDGVLFVKTQDEIRDDQRKGWTKVV